MQFGRGHINTLRSLHDALEEEFLWNMLPLGLVEKAEVLIDVFVLRLLLLVLGDDMSTAQESYFRVAKKEVERFQTTTKVDSRTLVTLR